MATDQKYSDRGLEKETDTMNIIVNADKNWAIGKNNSLLVRIPADMKYFRQMTEGNIVVMGRKTLESFPQGRPLANRVNIVISHNPDYQVKDAIVVHSVEEALQECKKHKGEVFVIGGESIYRAMLPYCNIAYVTRTDHVYEADTWFPDLEKDPDWQKTAETDEQTYFDLEYVFAKYERIK